ncbi:MAG: putative ABC transporter permease [Smithellaceae bacterium]
MLDHNLSFFYYIILFAIYCFIGWVLEVIYRSFKQRKFVNAGFLFGPLVPIYGLGAFVIIVMQYFVQSWHFVPRFVVFGLSLTFLEYMIGFLSEKIFKLPLWNYSDHRFNLHGRVCLYFSFLWTVLALIIVEFIHPEIFRRVALLDESFVKPAAIAFMIYFWIDYTFSVMSLASFRSAVGYLYEEYFNLSNTEIEERLNSFQRLRDAFPDLNQYINQNINKKIRKRLNSILKTIQDKIILEMEGRKPFEKEYYETVEDILQHEEFLKLKDYFHHNSSIYAHVHDVAYFSYRICKYFRLDYRSAARGALLHDFFLYDWRNHDEPDLAREKFHGFAHPAIAVANAKKHFSINDIEEDIIKKHMWPLTLVPPKYKEAYIVSFADKYLSSKEFINEYKKRISQFQVKKGRKRKKTTPD